jgi:nitric oxide reductase subunit C
MPNLHITPDEAKGVVAFLKWMMLSIDTNGFPYNFKTIYATEE